MKVEPVSIKTLNGPRRVDVESHAAASELPNASPGDFASFDSIEISNPVPPPEQALGSGGTLTDLASDGAVEPDAIPLPGSDSGSPSLAAMLRTIKGYLAEDLKKFIEHHDDAPPVPVQNQQTQAGTPQPIATNTQPAQAASAAKSADPVRKAEPVEVGSQPEIPMPAGGFKPVAQAHPAPAPAPAPVHTQSPVPAPKAPVKEPVEQHQAA